MSILKLNLFVCMLDFVVNVMVYEMVLVEVCVVV